jgi:Glutaredoxin-like domain (DUF836)
MMVKGPLQGQQRTRRVILYGKPGCHLCDDAEKMLSRLARWYPMQVEKFDIRSDPDLYRQFDIRIPVLIIDGVTTLEAPLSEIEVREALR